MLEKLFKAIFKALIEALKEINYKGVAYKAWQEYKPTAKKKVEDTASKWDDKAYEGIDYAVEKFLKPEEK